jgi:hypothetical protein
MSRVFADIEEVGEDLFEGAISDPPISPEARSPPVIDNVFRPQFEELFYFMQTFPELRTTFPKALEQVVGIPVFRSDDSGPDGVVFLVEFPNPLGKQGDVHLFGVKQA